MNKETLKKFCSDDPYRKGLCELFSIGEFTYATNGHIAVRVALVEGVEQCDPKKHPFGAESLFKEAHSEIEFKPHEKMDLPGIELKTIKKECGCEELEHDCPDCECYKDKCGNCVDGYIFEEIQESEPMKIGDGFYDPTYIQLMQENLPNLMLSEKNEYMKPLAFKFDWGIGILMGRRDSSKCVKVKSGIR